MGVILKFPAARRLGYSRVRRRGRCADDPNQLDLFLPPPVRIEAFAPGLSAFEQALLCDERGDPQAAELYARAIEEQECVADAYCNLGILESKQGRTARAFDCFTRCLGENPRHVQAHYNLANLYFEVNDFRLAQVHYELAAEIDPEFANAWFNLALARSLLNELPGAIEALTRYRERVPAEEARHADELLHNLQQTLAAHTDTHVGS